MPTYLNVPFREKDEAKALGARFDGARKKWYVPDGKDAELFARWLDGGATAPTATAGGRVRDRQVDDGQPDLFALAPGRALATAAAGLLADPPADIADAAPGEVPRGVGLFEYLTIIHEVVNEIGRTPQWIRAEVSEYSVKPTGHAFLQLIEHDAAKKPLAKAGARIWARDLPGIAQRFAQGTGGELAAGMKILFLARAEFHQQWGFSLTISDIDPSFTLGDIEAKLREIRRVLQLEKLYERNRQLPLPGEFCRVAVISPSGAAGLGDFRAEADRLARFGLCTFAYYEATFQGTSAPGSVRAALIQALADHAREPFDAVAIIRGGGAKTDLADLNDLDLARAICCCPVPVFTGIGHERDNTALDEVAGTRFDTPSKVVKYIEEVIVRNAREAAGRWEFITATARNLVSETQRQAQAWAHALTTAARSTLAAAQQRVERAAAAVRGQAQLLLERAGGQAERQAQALSREARRRLEAAAQRLTVLRRDIARGAEAQALQVARRIEGQRAVVAMASPANTLKRGFAIVRGDGAIVSDRAKAGGCGMLEIEFRDGKLVARPVKQ